MNEQTIAKLLAYLTTQTELNISQSDLQQFTEYLNKQNFDLAYCMLEDLALGVIPETDTFWLIADLLIEIDCMLEDLALGVIPETALGVIPETDTFWLIADLLIEIDRIASQYN